MARRADIPAKFVSISDNRYVERTGATEGPVLDHAKKRFNQREYRDIQMIAIYQLVKVLRPKEVPVEIEEIATCKNAVAKKGK